MRYDIAIIGSGPAGLSAAINAKIRNKTIIMFGNDNLSNKLVKAPSIDNYLGFYDISGDELKDKFKSHIDSMDISIENKRINNIYAMGEYFTIMSGNDMYEATTVILATGVEYTRPIKGEEEFLGRGVGYCATCDAPLYRGKTVTIIGYNKEAEEEADFVSEVAEKVYYIPMYKDAVKVNENIEIVAKKPLEIVGEEKVSSIKTDDGELETDGVFVLKDSISPGQLVPGLEIEDGHIKVDREMKCNIPGCFAAGDCVGKPYQYIKSAGEGNIAALSAVKYIDTLKNK